MAIMKYIQKSQKELQLVGEQKLRYHPITES